MTRQREIWGALSRGRLFWPALILLAMVVLSAVITPGFLSIRVLDGHLYGTLIDILRFGAPLILVATGMTLVIATRGIDLSVGALVAIAAAIACTHIADSPAPDRVATVLTAVALALGAAAVVGAWNGFLIAVVGIQPIVATLILMTAGRGIAMLITNGQIITVVSSPYRRIGGGYWLGIPFSLVIAAGVVGAAALLTRRTALGMLIESVGVNAEASRLAGVRARTIIWMVYVVAAVCAATAGLIISSNVSSADANNAGLWIELDAILAVVIGGTALTGGRYSLAGTVLGALIIQTLSTTVYTAGIAPQVTLLFKAIVVIVVCLLNAPAFREKVARRKPGRRVAVERPRPMAEVPR